MKIIFAFRTRLSFPSPLLPASAVPFGSFKEKTFSICYAVVNLLLFLLRIFTYGHSRFLFTLLRLGQVRFRRFSFSAPSASRHLAYASCVSRALLPAEFAGGLKWTRTIDLTLIRRVL